MTLNDTDIPGLLDNLEANIAQQIQQRQLHDPIIIGIHTGGAWIAQIMHQRLQIQDPLYSMDIAFYRDDFSQIGMHPQIKPSQLPTQLEGRDIILIDDVFYTGRTIRAALNEIFDFGRPNQVVLAVLIERDGRQIPVRPDCVGAQITLPPGQRIKLTGPEPLGIHIQTVNQAA